jgi:hypothetical protein
MRPGAHTMSEPADKEWLEAYRRGTAAAKAGVERSPMGLHTGQHGRRRSPARTAARYSWRLPLHQPASII